MNGQSYCFVTRSEMEADIKNSQYLEHGEYDGNLYGTKIDSIHEVVDTGRTCILDINPQVRGVCTHSHSYVLTFTQDTVYLVEVHTKRWSCSVHRL